MNTTTTTQVPTTATTPVPGARYVAPTAASRRSKGLVIGAVAAVGIAAAGVITTLVMTLSGAGAQPAPAPTPAASHIVVPSGHSVKPLAPITPAKPVTPVAPSAAIETLQKELGQLNYYEGPVTGVMNAQTTQAITYLQRDANLPQTGTMNAATQAALTNFLANGNNQMAG
ncbi:MAG: hypothetical protein ABS81_24085 [Pseudonocardia sp. SCN 72-86]|nr:MAG: hypothetical protein ABS81_24085 [Pseudonocardia sp. SCN 72-86]